jgi:CelD/BcsL family acetyltransferase involved in cellulose biosynthesis
MSAPPASAGRAGDKAKPRDAAAAPELLRLALDDPRWAAFAAARVAATPFHHPAWAALLAETYRLPGFALALPDGDGGLAAGAPFLEARTLRGRRRWISLPFTDECAPLAAGDAAAATFAEALAAGAGALGAPGIELRSDAGAGALGWRTHAEALIAVLELDGDLDAVRKRFSRSQVLRNIARAEREGVTVRQAVTEADRDAFYALHAGTRRRQGVPVQPRRFFDLLWTRIVGAGLGTILLADAPAGGAPVAGALFLHWNGTTIYKFGASEPEAWKLRPNHLLFWTAIQESWARGDRRFDFGLTDAGNEGLRAFKRSWGGVERVLVFSSLDAGPGTARPGLASRVGGAAIRHGPAWLGRAAGTALYRYAGSR